MAFFMKIKKKEKSANLLFQRFSWVWLYRIRLTVTKQASNSHQILTQMLLNPDWCTKVGDIALLQVSPAYFIPVRRAQEKKRNTEISHAR